LILQSAQHVSGKGFCPSSGAQDCDLQHVVYCNQIVVGRWSGARRNGLCVRCEGCRSRERHPSHRTHSPFRRAPDHRPTTIWLQYTTCCKSQSCAPEDGQKPLPETCWADCKINKLLLLYLIGYSTLFISMTQFKHTKNVSQFAPLTRLYLHFVVMKRLSIFCWYHEIFY